MPISYDKSLLAGTNAGLVGLFKISATVVLGQPVINDGTNPGEVTDATTTSFVDAMGVTMQAGTYSTTLADPEGAVKVVYGPLSVFESRVAGGAATGDALDNTSPANLLINETADATALTVTDDAVGTISMIGGLLFGLTGGNKGQSRKMTAHTNSVSTGVTVPFLRTIAVNDRFVRVPWSKSQFALQLTTLLNEVDGTIATGSGGVAAIVEVFVDDYSPTAPEVKVRFVFRDHNYNPLS